MQIHVCVVHYTTGKRLHDKELEYDAFKRPNRGDESLVESIRNCEIRLRK